MRITIEGVKQAPKWETLQTMLREACKDEGLTLIRINRPDNGVDYRGLGKYELDLISCGEKVSLTLEYK